MKSLKPFADKKEGLINAIIETPKGSRNKFNYNPENGYYELCKILPAGTAFPLDFGFIPGTLAADGDPLDVLVITDTPAFTGCLVHCRVIGVIEAEQTEKDKKKERNDRIVAVSVASLDDSDLKSLKEVNKHMLKELIHFFEYYNSMCGKKFALIGTRGPGTALSLIKKLSVHPKK